ncbi:MAG: hypothetical protein AAF623_16295 [Planctomycetota bacterium]
MYEKNETQQVIITQIGDLIFDIQIGLVQALKKAELVKAESVVKC